MTVVREEVFPVRASEDVVTARQVVREWVEEALRDGYTTGFGLGLGLGGARRLSNEFELQSAPGTGTRVRIARWRP